MTFNNLSVSTVNSLGSLQNGLLRFNHLFIIHIYYYSFILLCPNFNLSETCEVVLAKRWCLRGTSWHDRDFYCSQIILMANATDLSKYYREWSNKLDFSS